MAILSNQLERFDKELVPSYLSDDWEIYRREERQLTFRFGIVIFKRRRLRKSGEKILLLLDHALGFLSREYFSYQAHTISQVQIVLHGATSTPIGQLKKRLKDFFNFPRIT